MAEPVSLRPEHDVLIRKLRSISPLSDDETHCLMTLPLRTRDVGPDQPVVQEGDRPSECCLVVEGFTCRYKLTAAGKRQIFSFHLPGDIPDLQSLHLRVLDTSLGTITPCKVGFIRHEVLHDLCGRYPRIAGALWRQTLIDAAVFREWMASIGQREAYHRIAHLLCEMMVRMRAVGLTQDHTCDVPITQAEFGDALGISTVHINRVLQALRQEKLIVLRGGSLTVLNWEGLKNAGQFDATYLHLAKTKVAHRAVEQDRPGS